MALFAIFAGPRKRPHGGGSDEFLLGAHRIQVYDTPGYTRGHIVYHFPDDGIAFVGDTLFAMGCGRLFEGSAAQMWHSLQKILAWRDDPCLYCAHEYTQANARFALSVEPGNRALVERAGGVDRQRQKNLPTVRRRCLSRRRRTPSCGRGAEICARR